MLGLRRFFKVFALVATCVLTGQYALADGGSESPDFQTMAVLPLSGQESQGFGDLGDAVNQRVTTAFFKTKRFLMIERAQLSRILREGKLQDSTLVDDETAINLGKQVGAKTVVVGSYKALIERKVDVGDGYRIEIYPSKMDLNLRLVDVQTGRVKDVIQISGRGKQRSASASQEELMNDVATKLEREVSNHFPLAGYVIKVLDGKEALIDLGAKDGISEGAEFTVVEYGEDLVHPVTGKVIKGEKKIITECEITRVSEETSVAKITGSEAPLRVGLMLESKPKKAGFWENFTDFANR